VSTATLVAPPATARLLGWVRLVHAFPVAMVTAATGAVAWASGGESASPARIALVTLAMFFGQCSVGIQNDYLDRFRDGVAKPAKPIPAGLVGAAHARVAWVLCLAVFAALHVSLGLPTLAVGVAALSAGFSYNQRLKFSRLGFLAYVAGFSLLGAWVWVATEAVRAELLWALVLGPPMLAGLGISNMIPDVVGDARTGVRTLATALGRARAAAASWGLFAAGWLAALVGAAVVDVDATRLVLSLALSLLLSAGGVACTAGGRDWPAFRLYGLATAVVLVGWLWAAG